MTSNLKPFDLEAAKRGEPIVLVFNDEQDEQHQVKGFMFAGSGFMSAVQIVDGSVWYFDQSNGLGDDFTLFMAAPAIPEDILSLEDAVFQLACALNDGDLPHSELKGFVQAFAEAIVQRAVEKMKESK